MSDGCQEAVQALAKCNGRERVDHIVAIHINAFTGNFHINAFTGNVHINAFTGNVEPSKIFFLSIQIIQVFSYVAILKARRRNKINTTHHVPTLTLQYIVTTDAATRSLHNFPMPNVGSGRRAESPHKKRCMNAFTKLRKPPYYVLL